MLDTFLTCECKSRNQLDGWCKPEARRAIEFGNFGHWLLEHWYKAENIGLENSTYEDAAEFYEMMEPAWVERLIGIGYPAEAIEEDLALMAPLFPAYVVHWKGQDAKFNWEATEHKFDVEWQGFRLRGMIDGVLKMGRSTYTFESKFRGRFSTNEELKLAFDPQCLFYLNAAEVWKGKTMRGTIYNNVRKPQLKLNKKGVKDLTDRVRVDISKRPEWYFIRHELVYTKNDKRRFRTQLLQKLNMFKAWVEGGMIPLRREGACMGRYTCEYLESCAKNTMIGYKQTAKRFQELED